jgi:tRNA pseudouridine13 synthase
VEDFLVEEVPLHAPAGRGDHLLVQIEKRGVSTLDAMLWLSKAAKVSERVIGYAGLKDARAVARQYFTLPKVPPERVLAMRQPRLKVLSVERHVNALKVGHLRGNRFTIRIRGARVERMAAARASLERMVARGMPNPYGGQRFGVKQDAHRLGRAVVEEDWAGFLDLLLGSPSDREMDPRVRAAREAYGDGDLARAFRLFPLKNRSEKKALGALMRTGSPREAFQALGKRPQRIWVCAWQSYVFNRVLDRRVREGTWDRLLPGDVAWLHESGACFPVRADVPEEPGLEASPTGPLIGSDLVRPTGAPGRIEEEVFREEGADPEAFRSSWARARGTRRPLRVPVREASLELEGTSVVARFLLPPGTFATVLLGHLMAGGPDAADEPGEADPEDVPEHG